MRCKVIATERKVFEVIIEAILLKENSRAYDFEHINLNDMFRPKDIIRAKVLSVKEAKGNSVVSISTAENEFGVICKFLF